LTSPAADGDARSPSSCDSVDGHGEEETTSVEIEATERVINGFLRRINRDAGLDGSTAAKAPVTAAEVWAENNVVPAPTGLAEGKAWTALIATGRVKVPDRAQPPAAVAAGLPPQANSASLTNPNRLWLTYETRFNWATFAKTDQRVDLRLYAMPASCVVLLLAPPDDLPDDTLEALAKVFFPKMQTAELRAFGELPWNGDAVIPQPPQPSGGRAAAGAQAAAALPYFAVLPYNRRDNTDESTAIGTRPLDGVRLTPLEATLPMWNTASRSSLASIDGVETRNSRAVPVPGNGGLWPGFCDAKSTRFPTPDPAGGMALDLAAYGADFHNKIFSVKSGVNYIGTQKQASKAVLEHNSILAVQRSAYIRLVERTFGRNPYDDPHLLILTEVMTVMRRHSLWEPWFRWQRGEPTWADRAKFGETGPPQPAFGDGYQIRSLRGIKHDKKYFPPTSIPFVKIAARRIDAASTCRISHGDEMKAPTGPDSALQAGMPRSEALLEQLDAPGWSDFWRIHYAEPLARAKATLLLRYGLQGFGGNAQNFLLEMDNGVPNGRVIVRDMGDYALHDFVLWALFGPGGAPPDPRGLATGNQEAIVQQWQQAFKDTPLLAFECNILHRIKNEKCGQSEFPTWTGYHRHTDTAMATLNMFCDCCVKGANFVGHISPLFCYAMPVSPNAQVYFYANLSMRQWAKFHYIQTQWGIAHARAWISEIERETGHDFRIDWRPVTLAEAQRVANEKARFSRPLEPDEFLRVPGAQDDTLFRAGDQVAASMPSGCLFPISTSISRGGRCTSAGRSRTTSVRSKGKPRSAASSADRARSEHVRSRHRRRERRQRDVSRARGRLHRQHRAQVRPLRGHGLGPSRQRRPQIGTRQPRSPPRRRSGHHPREAATRGELRGRSQASVPAQGNPEDPPDPPRRLRREPAEQHEGHRGGRRRRAGECRRGRRRLGRARHRAQREDRHRATRGRE
jgi:hypothetical protein